MINLEDKFNIRILKVTEIAKYWSEFALNKHYFLCVHFFMFLFSYLNSGLCLSKYVCWLYHEMMDFFGFL